MLAAPSLPPPRSFKALLEVNQIPHDVWVLIEAYYHGVCLSSEEDIGTKRKQHTPLPQPLSDVKPIRMLYARELACLHGSGGGLHIS